MQENAVWFLLCILTFALQGISSRTAFKESILGSMLISSEPFNCSWLYQKCAKRNKPRMQNLFEFSFEAASKNSLHCFQHCKIFMLCALQSANEDYDLIYCIRTYILFILHLCNQERYFHDLLPARSLTRLFRPIENSQLIKG